MHLPESAPQHLLDLQEKWRANSAALRAKGIERTALNSEVPAARRKDQEAESAALSANKPMPQQTHQQALTERIAEASREIDARVRLAYQLEKDLVLAVEAERPGWLPDLEHEVAQREVNLADAYEAFVHSVHERDRVVAEALWLGEITYRPPKSNDIGGFRSQIQWPSDRSPAASQEAISAAAGALKKEESE